MRLAVPARRSRLQFVPQALRAELRHPDSSHTTPYLTPNQVPRPPSLRAASSWTVSTLPFGFFVCRSSTSGRALFFARRRPRSSPSIPSRIHVGASRNTPKTPGTDEYNASIASARPLSPILHSLPTYGATALSRLSSITRSSTIDLFHQTSIEEVLPSIPGYILVHLSRVVLLYPTHPLSPAGPMRISRYHADHLTQLRPS